MVKGRPPKPTELHIRDGTLHSRHKSKTPLIIGGKEKPSCPAFLTAAGKEMFNAVIDDMWQSGILDKADSSLIAAAAMSWQCAREAGLAIAKYGLIVEEERPRGVVQKANPAVKIQRDALTEYRHCCERLGIGPVARARLAGMGIKSKTVERDIPGLGLLTLLRGDDEDEDS